MTADSPAEANASPAPGGLVRRAGMLCAAVALFSGALLGGLEFWHPVFGAVARYALTPATPAQLWVYAIVQAIKSVAFIAALTGFFVIATRRGPVSTGVTWLAAVGGAFFAFVWFRIAATGRDDAVYVLGHAIGSDGRSNGALFCFWLAPIVLGASALRPHRVPRWHAAWLIVTGVLGARVFAMFPVGVAFAIEGVLWCVVGAIVYSGARGT
jgi:hypothetical protein